MLVNRIVTEFCSTASVINDAVLCLGGTCQEHPKAARICETRSHQRLRSYYDITGKPIGFWSKRNVVENDNPNPRMHRKYHRAIGSGYRVCNQAPPKRSAEQNSPPVKLSPTCLTGEVNCSFQEQGIQCPPQNTARRDPLLGQTMENPVKVVPTAVQTSNVYKSSS